VTSRSSAAGTHLSARRSALAPVTELIMLAAAALAFPASDRNRWPPPQLPGVARYHLEFIVETVGAQRRPGNTFRTARNVRTSSPTAGQGRWAPRFLAADVCSPPPLPRWHRLAATAGNAVDFVKTHENPQTRTINISRPRLGNTLPPRANNVSKQRSLCYAKGAPQRRQDVELP